eukprot:11220041-Ditylum_brightwellii.AAC.1
MNCDLFTQHIHHFSQADGTPSTRRPITESGQYLELPLGEAFYNGTLDIDMLNTDCYTKECLKELQPQSSDSPCISTELSAKDIKANYKKWKEGTSVSPADQHIGLYKTWIHIPKEKEEEYNRLTPDEFFMVASKIMNAEKHKYFNEDQHGRHNSRNVIDIGLGKSFRMDIIHLQ